jgi:hypothetical protein
MVVFLTIFIGLKAKDGEKTALFPPAREILSWQKSEVIQGMSKGCQECVRRVIAFCAREPKRRTELAQWLELQERENIEAALQETGNEEHLIHALTSRHHDVMMSVCQCTAFHCTHKSKKYWRRT